MLKVDDKVLGHVQQPNRTERIMGVEVKTNSNGLRNKEIGYKKPADTIRIVALGDSLLFGWGVPYNKTFIKILEDELNNKNLRKKNFKYEIINTGHPGYNAEREYLYLLNKGLKYAPDCVIVFYYINDVEPYQYLKNNSAISWSKFLTFGFTIFKKIVNAKKYKNYYIELYRDDSPYWISCKEYTIKTINLCKDNKINIIYVMLPELWDLKNYRYLGIHEKIAKTVKANHVQFLDLYGSINNLEPSKLWNNSTDIHPNILCSKIYAQKIYEYLTYSSIENHHD